MIFNEINQLKMFLKDKLLAKDCTCIQSKELENVLKLRDNEIGKV